jgi:glutaminyl-peptide cyclotransferase
MSDIGIILTRSVFWAIAGLCILSCSSKQKIITAPDFSGDRAFEYIQKQVSFGPRVPGSANSTACRAYLIDFFRALGAEVDTMPFIHNDKITGKPIRMVNIIAHFPGAGKASESYLLAAHYDSRPRADHDPDSTKRSNAIDGANDGASGVAVLMELGNLLAERKPRVNVDMALLDGEDWGLSGDLDEYFLGAKELIMHSIKGKYKFALIIDMIGDKDLNIYREEFSSKYFPEISNLIWKTASQLGEKAFIDTVGYAVYDDHLSFMTIDLPSAVIIDFHYPYWHTIADTPDKCSPQSLRAVGRVVSTIIYGL